MTITGMSAFSQCVALRRLYISESVACIGAHAFEGCTALSDLTIPAALHRVGYRAFEAVTGVSTLTLLDGELSNELVRAMRRCLTADARVSSGLLAGRPFGEKGGVGDSHHPYVTDANHLRWRRTQDGHPS